MCEVLKSNSRFVRALIVISLLCGFFPTVVISPIANAAGIACPTTTYLPNTSGNYPGDHGTNWATKNYLKSNNIYFKINKDSGEAIAVGYNNSVTALVIPETITVTSQIIGAAGFDSSTDNCTAFAKQYKVRYIGTKAFASNGTAGKLLDSITINANIKSISEYAFEYQCRITSLVIPDSVTDIGESAFWKMDLSVDTNDACAGRGLQTVTLGINLLRVGFQAFQQDQQLTSVTFRGQVLRTTTSNNEMVYPSNYDLWNYNLEFNPARTNNLCAGIFAYANLSLNVLSGKGSDWRTWGTVGNCLNQSSVITQTITTSPSKIDAPVASNATQTTADVAFTASLNGGSPITGYRVTSVPGGVTATLSGATAGSVTVTGLSPGTNYKFFVVAINANGESSESELSNQITTSVLTVPAISLLPISETVTVGTAINGYVISNSGGATTSYSISPAISETPGLTFNNATGLISGTPTEIAAAKSYTISASNSAGLSSTNGTFTLTVNPRTISIANLPITAPVSGATPLSSLSSNGQYTTAITWNGSPTTFATSTVYTATATLTPVAGYTLTGVTANFFTVAGATSVANSANSGVITAVFPTTAAMVSDNSTTERVETGPPPSFLKVKTPPTISLIADIYTCTAGSLIFWRYSVTEEPAKITYQKISLHKNGENVASSLTVKSQASFEKNSSWAGSTMTCQIEAAQESTIGTFSSLAADKYNELSKIKAAATKAADAKYFSDRKAAYDTRRVELSRIYYEKANELKVAKTSAQVKAAADKYRLAMTRISQTWKAETQAAPARRDASVAAAAATFIQGLAQHGLSIIQP